MALFERQLAALKQQMGGLDTSQRVALGLCAALVGGSILWLTQWSMQREMVPLYAEVLTDDQIADITQQLALRGEPFQEAPGQILVRPEDRRRLFMSLVEGNNGPESFQFTFNELVGNENVFAPESSRRRQYLIALMSELSAMIRTMNGVKDARVVIADDNAQMRLGYAKGKTKATVQVSMTGKERLEQGIVEALVRLVAGAVPRLEPRDVAVIDALGRAYRIADPAQAVPTDLYGLQRRKERELQDKIEKLLAHIPNHMVTVTLKLDTESSHTTGIKMGEPPVKRESREEQSTTNRVAAMEPGVEPNVGAALTGLNSARGDSTERTEVEYSEVRDKTEVTTTKLPGEILEAAASVLIPRSYFVAALRSMSADPDREPTKNEVEDLIAAEKPRIKDLLTPILVAANAPKIEVDVYYDEARAFVLDAPDEAVATTGGVMDYVSTNGKQLGLVAMALLAMGMMFQMVRRAGDTPPLPDELRGSGAAFEELLTDDGPIGEAGAPDGFLIARETDEGTIRARHVAQQVSDLINDDPEKAAQLVQRWITRDT